MAAINYYQLVQFLFDYVWDAMDPYADAMGLLLVFLIVFLLLQNLAAKFVEEHTEMNAAVNAIAGGLFGCLSGLLLAGILAISWFMTPGAAYFLGDDPKGPTVIFNVDELFLTTARFIANERIDGSEQFDPMHVFMKERTNKYHGAKGIKIEGADASRPKRPTSNTEDEDLRRSR